MSDTANPFGISIPKANEKPLNLGKLKARTKPEAKPEDIDSAGDRHGFTSREPAPAVAAKPKPAPKPAKALRVVESKPAPVQETPKKRGRPPSPRTGQVHAKVLPPIQDEIAEEARRRGVVQGVIIEEAWALYKKTL